MDLNVVMNASGELLELQGTAEGATFSRQQLNLLLDRAEPGLKQLMREIATTHPYFVRCIKPNQLLKPGVFNAAMILRQLQCSGTIECVKLMQAGYPNRAPYRDLQTRFKTALPPKMAALEPRQFVGMLLQATDSVAGDFQMGQDMVFFKGSKGALLQELQGHAPAAPSSAHAAASAASTPKVGRQRSTSSPLALTSTKPSMPSGSVDG